MVKFAVLLLVVLLFVGCFAGRDQELDQLIRENKATELNEYLRSHHWWEWKNHLNEIVPVLEAAGFDTISLEEMVTLLEEQHKQTEETNRARRDEATRHIPSVIGAAKKAAITGETFAVKTEGEPWIATH